jgi:hypothetical protein
MATGFQERVKGKIAAAAIWLGSGGIVDKTTGIAGKVQSVVRLALPVTAVANTDFTLSIPPGATIAALTVYTTTAYTASTDAQVSIGNAAGGAQYVAAVSVKAIGVYGLTFVGTAAAAFLAAPAGSPNLFVRIAQTGTATAVGAATLVVEYSMA